MFQLVLITTYKIEIDCRHAQIFGKVQYSGCKMLVDKHVFALGVVCVGLGND